VEIATRTLLEKVFISGIEKVKCQSNDLEDESSGCSEELHGVLSSSLLRFFGWLPTGVGVSSNATDPLSFRSARCMYKFNIK